MLLLTAVHVCCLTRLLCSLLQSFVDAPPERVAQVVQTNLLGCLLCTRAAMRAMAAQPSGAPPRMHACMFCSCHTILTLSLPLCP